MLNDSRRQTKAKLLLLSCFLAIPYSDRLAGKHGAIRRCSFRKSIIKEAVGSSSLEPFEMSISAITILKM